MRRASSFGVALAALAVTACAAEAPTSEQGALSPQLEAAIDTVVELKADPITAAPGGAASGTASSTSSGGRTKDTLAGVSPTALSSALRAGATSVPWGGAATSGAGAGFGGVGVGATTPGGAGRGTGAGFGGAAAGPSSAGGLGSFADAACYLVRAVCNYAARCADEIVDGTCTIPSTCPTIVAAALAKAGNPPIPPQATTVFRCLGDALASASCIGNDLDRGVRGPLLRCVGTLLTAEPALTGK